VTSGFDSTIAHKLSIPVRTRSGRRSSVLHLCITDAVMLVMSVRTIIDLPDDLYKQALAIARDTHRTLSETVADLMRRGLRANGTAAIPIDSRTGLPMVSVGAVATSEDVRSLEDDERVQHAPASPSESWMPWSASPPACLRHL
jgi:Arc/MetJ family transcription regulator